jgi:hypothetical protein
MNRFANAHVRAASTDVAGHRGVDVFICGRRFGREQRGGRHDLPGLAVAALRYVQFDPCLLQRMTTIRRQAFDRRDRFASHRTHRRDARTSSGAFNVNRASATQRHAATVLGAGHSQRVTQYPKKGRVIGDVDIVRLPVDRQLDHGFPRRDASLSAPV